MNVVVYATNGLLQLLYSYRMFLRTYLLMDVSHFPRTAKGQNDMQICIHGGKKYRKKHLAISYLSFKNLQLK